MALEIMMTKWNKQAYQTLAGMLFFQALNFFSGLLIARGLGPAGQGKFQTMMATTFFIVTICKLGLDEGIAYIIPTYRAESPDKIGKLIKYIIMVAIIIGIAIGFVCFLTSGLLEALLFKLPGFGSDLKNQFFLVPSLMLLLMVMAVLRGLGRSDLRAYVYYYVVGIAFILPVTYFYIKGATPQQIYYARGFSFILGSIAGLLFIYSVSPSGNQALNRTDLKKVHSFSALLILISIMQYIIEQPFVDLIIVGRLSSAATVGLYSVASKIGLLSALAINAFTMAMAPAFAALSAKKDLEGLKQLYEKSSLWILRLSIYGGGSLFLLERELLGFFGSAYVQGEMFLNIFLIGQVLVGCMGLNSPLMVSAGYLKWEFILTSIFSITMISSGILLGMLYGPIGVAVATSSSLLIIALSRRVFCYYTFGFGFDKNSLKILLFGVISLIGAVKLPPQVIPTTRSQFGFIALIIFSSIFWAPYMLKLKTRLDSPA